ncbi:MAG TPA: VWA domain-containing protein [Pyrinomonadaceae bacterium]|jgi:Ca-activated chloride channel family protein|nr:VWA domain-containing protein [Pyrinomonadaceae bacterium]
MRKIVSGLMAPICLVALAVVAYSQDTTNTPALKGETGKPILGDAPAPPVLKKAPAPVPVEAEKAKEPEHPEIGEGDVVRISTSLITVPAQVMDRNGRLIGNLKQEDFVLFENGVQQQVSYFGSIEQPFTVALLLDVSGSTQTRLQAIRSAANAFITRLRPNDRIILVSFDGKVNILCEPMTVAQLRTTKLRLDAVNDGTLLYDTVDEILNRRLAGIPGRKAIVMLTDGVDQGSKRASRKQNLRDANESEVQIYTVQYNTLPQLPERLSHFTDPKVRARLQSRMEKEYASGSAYLQTLAEQTGGRLYNADTLPDIQQSFGAIMDELGRQYSLGYYPKGEARPGERRDIKVRVRIPNLVVKARENYVASIAGVARASRP